MANPENTPSLQAPQDARCADAVEISLRAVQFQSMNVVHRTRLGHAHPASHITVSHGSRAVLHAVH